MQLAELAALHPPVPALAPVRCLGRDAALSPKAAGGAVELAPNTFFTWSCAEDSALVVVNEFALLSPTVEPVSLVLELSAAPLAVTRNALSRAILVCTSAGDVVCVDTESLQVSVEHISDGVHSCASIGERGATFGLTSGRVIMALWEQSVCDGSRPLVQDLVEASIVSRLFKAWSPSFAVCAVSCLPEQGGRFALAIYGDGRVRLWDGQQAACIGGASLTGDASVQLHSVVLSRVAQEEYIAQSHAPGALPQVDVLKVSSQGRITVEAASADAERKGLKSFHARGAARIGAFGLITSWWSESKVCCVLDVAGHGCLHIDPILEASGKLDKDFGMQSVRAAFAAVTGRAVDASWTMDSIKRAVDNLPDRTIVWHRLTTECQRLVREQRQVLAMVGTSSGAALHVRSCGVFLVCPAAASNDSEALGPVLQCSMTLANRLKLALAAPADFVAFAKEIALALPNTALEELQPIAHMNPTELGDAFYDELARHAKMDFTVDRAAPQASAVSSCIALAAQDVVAQRARAVQFQTLALLVTALVCSRGLARPHAKLKQARVCAQARAGFAVSAAALEACRLDVVSDWARSCLGRPESISDLYVHAWPRFLSSVLSWMRDAHHKGLEAVALKLVDAGETDPRVDAIMAQGLLHSAFLLTSPEDLAKRRAKLLLARSGYMRAASRLDLSGDALLCIAQQFERAMDSASTMFLAESALEAGCNPEAALFTVLAAVGVDPEPDYAAALAWACKEPKYVRQLVMTMLARDHCSQLCSLAMDADSLDRVSRAVDEALYAAVADSRQPRLALSCLAFFLRFGQYEAAASAAYRLAISLPADSMEALKLRSHVLAACLTAMRLDPKNGGGRLLVEEKGMHGHERRSVVRTVTLHQVEIDYARNTALEIVGPAMAQFTVLDIVEALLSAPGGGRWDLALRLAELDGAPMDGLLSALAVSCAQGRESWSLLRRSLAKQPWSVYGSVLDVLLANDFEIPEWLMSGLFPNGSFARGGNTSVGLSVLLRRGKLLLATQTAARCVPSEANLAEIAQLRDAPWLPLHILEFILTTGSRVAEREVSEGAQWGVVDLDDVKVLRGSLKTLQAKLVDYLRGLAKVEPSRASMLKHL